MKLKEPTRRKPRQDRMIHEMIHDCYKTGARPPEPTVCPTYNAIYHEGRWQWADSYPCRAHKQMCPACHPVKDRYPAGVIIDRCTACKGIFFDELEKERLQEIKDGDGVDIGSPGIGA